MSAVTPMLSAADLQAILVSQAEQAHAKYPQYAGHWDGWVVVRATRTIRTKLGLALQAGDLVLMRPATEAAYWDHAREEHAFQVEVLRRKPRAFVTVYSWRNGVDTSVPAGAVTLEAR